MLKKIDIRMRVRGKTQRQDKSSIKLVNVQMYNWAVDNTLCIVLATPKNEPA